MISTELITGASVSNVTILVTLEERPPLSVAVTTIVFAPSARVIVVLKLPLESTVTLVAVPPFILTVTDLTPAVTSLVLPVNTQDALLVTRLLVGADTDKVGGVASL